MLLDLLKLKCPKCRKGDIFPTKNPYSFGNFTTMNATCPHCHEIYEKETGFFWGAMYVSYGLAVAIGVTTGILVYLSKGWDPILIFGTVLTSILVFSPVIFRLSRTIWLYIFIDQDESL